MEVESAKCECCGLKEDCTQDYINEVKSNFGGKWLCGLCSEAVRDEVIRTSRGVHCTNRTSCNNIGSSISEELEEAVRAHMSFCGTKFNSNPAFGVADGMRQMLRRRSSDLSSPSSSTKKYARCSSSKFY